MKFSLELLPNEPVRNIVDVIKLAEDIGFDNVWITDHYNNRDVFEVLAIVASNTSTIKMGSGVSNPYVRNPVTIAAATATLDEISDGRAIVGVGPGDKATMETLNLTWNKPVATVKEAIHTCLEAGITPIMITGDSLNTAMAIAKKIDLSTNNNEGIEGKSLAKYSDEEMIDIVKKYQCRFT